MLESLIIGFAIAFWFYKPDSRTKQEKFDEEFEEYYEKNHSSN